MINIEVRIQKEPLLLGRDGADRLVVWLNETEARGFEWRMIEVDRDSWGRWSAHHRQPKKALPVIIEAWDQSALFFGYLGQPMLTTYGEDAVRRKGDWSNISMLNEDTICHRIGGRNNGEDTSH